MRADGASSSAVMFESMEKYLFMRPLLDLLGQARFFTRAVAIVLRVIAALIVLFSLTTFFEAGKIIFELPNSGILGGVLFEVFFVLAVYAVVHVLLIRARDVDALALGEFYALRIGAILAKLLGEAYAAFVGLVAMGGGIFVWFTNLGIGKVLNPLTRALFPGTQDDPSFTGGIEFMLSGILAAGAVLVLAYALSETISVVARLGREPAGAAERASIEQPYRSRFGS